MSDQRRGARVSGSHIAAVRHFNRFYTRQIGVLHESVYGSAFSLAEVRVLYELAHRERPSASLLARELGIDPGYLSRILRGFARQGLLTRRPSPTDRRKNLLELSTAGKRRFAALDARASAEVGELLAALPEDDQQRLVTALREVERVLDGGPAAPGSYALRPHRPGDLGWVVHRHGTLYAQEYGWDERFEALVAQIVSQFIQTFDAERERCWIAERRGEIVGSVLLVKRSKTIAQLRLLLVEPSARGLGIGGRLIDECVRFARQAGYRKLSLWTQSNLQAARHLYAQAGFRCVEERAHQSFGTDAVSETWVLGLEGESR
jgi:DNA-binding MarR family transcriptional regulator/N-acetylglutamate synthase-like GNAT family acetyltransferase